jgi:hypothetical protein
MDDTRILMEAITDIAARWNRIAKHMARLIYIKIKL